MGYCTWDWISFINYCKTLHVHNRVPEELLNPEMCIKAAFLYSGDELLDAVSDNWNERLENTIHLENGTPCGSHSYSIKETTLSVT